MNTCLRAVAAAILAITIARAAEANIIVGLVVDPATPAGIDVSSIYSGAGTWHLFAVDDNVGDFGISTYNVRLAGATTIRNTSPLACQIQDIDGNIQQAGFNILRSPSGLPADSSVHASQSLPGQSPFLFTGLGQEANNFAAKASEAQPGSTVLPGVVSPSWGTYNTISPLNGKNWLFLGEGTYDSGVLPTVSDAAFTVFTNPTTFRSSFSDTVIVPEPITPTLLTSEYVNHLTPRPLPNSTPAPAPAPEPEPQPVVVVTPPVDDQPPPPVTNQVPPETQPPGSPVDPPISLVEWTEDPSNEGGSYNSFIYNIDPFDLTTITILPYGLYAHHWILQSAMATNLGGETSQTIFGTAGEDIQVDSSWMPMAIGTGVDHDGLDSARFAFAEPTGSYFFDSQAMQEAASAPEPAGVFLMLAAQGCLLLFARCRRR